MLRGVDRGPARRRTPLACAEELLDSPAETIVVLGLEASIPDSAWRILGAIDVASTSREVVFVCRASALAGVTPPPAITVVAVPDNAPEPEAQARLLGVGHASGDLVRITTLVELEAAWESASARGAADWIRMLEARGATRPRRSNGNGR